LRTAQIIAWVVLALSLFFLDRVVKSSFLNMVTRSDG
jgi:hypothetical protein